MYGTVNQPFVIGYTYRDDHYCPACIIKAMTDTEDFQGWALAPGLPPLSAEDDLDQIAAHFGIDRHDERTFDSSEFPKVVTRQHESALEDVCALCTDPLSPEGHTVRVNVAYDDTGAPASWSVRTCYCHRPWTH